MNQSTTISTTSTSSLLPMLLASTIGLAIVGLSGLTQSHALHKSEHDMRHANGFPCH